MLKLEYASETMNFHGFTVKPGFYYGVDCETNTPIATSGWESDGCAGIYFLYPEGFRLYWVDPEEEEIQACGYPMPETEGKISFAKWLSECCGIDWNSFDENYSDCALKEIEEEYRLYFYDELPRFVTRELEWARIRKEQKK